MLKMWSVIGAIGTVVCAVFAALSYVRDIKRDRKQKKQPPSTKE